MPTSLGNTLPSCLFRVSTPKRAPPTHACQWCRPRVARIAPWQRTARYSRWDLRRASCEHARQWRPPARVWRLGLRLAYDESCPIYGEFDDLNMEPFASLGLVVRCPCCADRPSPLIGPNACAARRQRQGFSATGTASLHLSAVRGGALARSAASAVRSRFLSPYPLPSCCTSASTSASVPAARRPRRPCPHPAHARGGLYEVHEPEG